jgi:hypothetical protein
VLNRLAQAETVPEGDLREAFGREGGVEPGDFERVMAYLEEDYYVERRDAGYGFRSKLLRDFWRRHGGAE